MTTAREELTVRHHMTDLAGSVLGRVLTFTVAALTAGFDKGGCSGDIDSSRLEDGDVS